MPAQRSASMPARDRDAMVTWRDGIHLQGTPIWCDARRTRDVCFVSCAHAAGASRHGQLIATAPTLALLGADPRGTQLPVPYGRPFTLGTVRLELLRSGHTLGSAALVADVRGQRVLYAGAVNPRGGGLGDAADLRACDALVLAATYGHPRYRFPPVATVMAEVVAFVHEVTAAGGVAALLVSSPSKALDVACRLAEQTTVPLLAHRSICEAARRLRAAHPALPRLRRWAPGPAGARNPGRKTSPKPGRKSNPPAGVSSGFALLWPARQRQALAGLAALAAGSRTALVSGRALDQEHVASLEVDAAYAWSNQADCDDLVAFIESCGARDVFLIHRHAETLAAVLHSDARRVRALGPPLQMPLFVS
jgi:putative mRNA 3-end processing factor